MIPGSGNGTWDSRGSGMSMDAASPRVSDATSLAFIGSTGKKLQSDLDDVGEREEDENDDGAGQFFQGFRKSAMTGDLFGGSFMDTLFVEVIATCLSHHP